MQTKYLIIGRGESRFRNTLSPSVYDDDQSIELISSVIHGLGY